MTAGKRHKQIKILNLNDGPESIPLHPSKERSRVYPSVRSHVQQEPIKFRYGEDLRHILRAYLSSSFTFKLCCGPVVIGLELL